ncbi:hypothetical protein TIFTF001_055536, partial [Ficus carica]
MLLLKPRLKVLFRDSERDTKPATAAVAQTTESGAYLQFPSPPPLPPPPPSSGP